VANRIVGNVYIVDSALNNVALPWPTHGKIMGVGAWFSGGTGEARFTGSDTTNVVIRIVAANSGLNATYNYHFLGGVDFDEMKIPVLTAGTAWIYFG
jgi:hypothetical protein